MKSRFGRGCRDAAREREIDLTLAVMCCLQQPGECVDRNTIAELTGLSHGGPYAIEQAALKKLRNRLFYLGGGELGKELL